MIFVNFLTKCSTGEYHIFFLVRPIRVVASGPKNPVFARSRSFVAMILYMISVLKVLNWVNSATAFSPLGGVVMSADVVEASVGSTGNTVAGSMMLALRGNNDDEGRGEDLRTDNGKSAKETGTDERLLRRLLRQLLLL